MNIGKIYQKIFRSPKLLHTRLFKFLKDIGIALVLKYISKLFGTKVNDKLIVFGSLKGKGMDRNTKSLYEFLSENSDYKVVWVTKSNQIIKDLRKKGLKAVHMQQISTIKLIRKAKFVFMSHNIFDFLPMEFSPKSTVVLTHHGTPIRYIKGEVDKEWLEKRKKPVAQYSRNLDVKLKEGRFHRNLGYSKWADYFKLKLKFHQYLDYILTPTTGGKEHEVLIRSFKMPPKKILALGYPRNDILFDENDPESVKMYRDKFQIPDNIKRVIMYAPTWRYGFVLKLPFESSDLDELNKFLEQTNSILLIKGHSFTKRDNIGIYNNIKVVDKGADIAELYLITDIIISDYSSLIFDYALLNRPILIYAYDYEHYYNTRGFIYELNDIAPGPILYNSKELLDALKNIDKVDKDYESKRIEIRDRFNKFKDGNSTNRLLDFLGIKYNKN